MSDIVSAEEIAGRLGVTRQLVHYWRTDLGGFPPPLKQLGGGDGKPSRATYIWAWPDVEGWALATGRLSAEGEPLRPPRSRPERGDE